jgi:hypothetical protein
VRVAAFRNVRPGHTRRFLDRARARACPRHYRRRRWLDEMSITGQRTGRGTAGP